MAKCGDDDLDGGVDANVVLVKGFGEWVALMDWSVRVGPSLSSSLVFSSWETLVSSSVGGLIHSSFFSLSTSSSFCSIVPFMSDDVLVILVLP